MRIYVSRICDKNGSQAVRKLLVYGFEEIYGQKMPEISKTEKGKPYFPTRPDVHFSLSHTDTHVMCVIGESAVGCDIQTVRQVSDRLKRHTCTESELKVFDFFQLWTLKESWIKLNGSIDRELRDIVFSGTPDNIIPPKPAKSAKLFKVDDCVVAVCCDSDEIPNELIEVKIFDN